VKPAALAALLLFFSCGPPTVPRGDLGVGLRTDLSGHDGQAILLGTRFTVTTSRNGQGPLTASVSGSSLQLEDQWTCGGPAVDTEEVRRRWESDMQDCLDEGWSWEECEDVYGTWDDAAPYGGDCESGAIVEAIAEGIGELVWWNDDGEEVASWGGSVAPAESIVVIPAELPTLALDDGDLLQLFWESPLTLRVRFLSGWGDDLRRRGPCATVTFGDEEADAITDAEVDVYSAPHVPASMDRIDFDMHRTDTDFSLRAAVLAEEQVEEIRIRVEDAISSQGWRCYRLEAYGRAGGQPIVGVPIDWAHGFLARIRLVGERTSRLCVPDGALAEPVYAGAAFAGGPVTARLLVAEGGPVPDDPAAALGAEPPPGQDEPERAEGAIGCSASGERAAPVLLLPLLLAAARRR